MGMGFGISMMDDGSVRRVLQTVAAIQQRNYVVMEIKANLCKEERKELFAKWAGNEFKRTVSVMVGEPPVDFKQRAQKLMLQQKQEVADAQFKLRHEEEKKKREH